MSDDLDKMLDTPCTLFPGNPTWREMAETVAARKATDPEFAVECQRDIDDFFAPSPLFRKLKGKG